DQKKPEFLKLNPYGKVPVLEDNGTVLFESCVINEYLEEKYPDPSLMPRDPRGRGRLRNLVDYGLYFTHSAFRALRDEMLKEEGNPDPSLVERAREVLRGQLRYLDQELEGKEYFLGEMTLADIDLITRFLSLECYGAVPAPSLPRLERWMDKMKERPSVQTIQKERGYI
ncbi:MAG: hypothetical protein GTO40_13855, partial [Deltaproteobacteria bacterium]|nr:hypothetical protein [Deltaproteobacteria bacterium]